jgi:hypothetical protein
MRMMRVTKCCVMNLLLACLGRIECCSHFVHSPAPPDHSPILNNRVGEGTFGGLSGRAGLSIDPLLTMATSCPVKLIDIYNAATVHTLPLP